MPFDVLYSLCVGVVFLWRGVRRFGSGRVAAGLSCGLSWFELSAWCGAWAFYCRVCVVIVGGGLPSACRRRCVGGFVFVGDFDFTVGSVWQCWEGELCIVYCICVILSLLFNLWFAICTNLLIITFHIAVLVLVVGFSGGWTSSGMVGLVVNKKKL